MKLISILTPLLLAAPLAAGPAAAQYPYKPIRLIVPFATGGPTDTAARIVSQSLAARLGQPIVIENRPGAGGALAGQAAAAAPADGYTLFFATNSVLAAQHVTRPAPFDALADFAPVATVGQFGFAVYTHPGVPAQSLKQLAAHALGNSGKLGYASNNLIEDLAASQFMKAAGAELTRVPYKGMALALPDLIAGRVPVYFGPITGSMLQHVKEGKLRMLATLLPQRTPTTPDIPSAAEAGYPGLAISSHQMYLAPARTPREIVERLSREINAAIRNEAVRSQLEKHGLFVEGMTTQELATMIRQADRTWAQFARDYNLAQQ